MISPFRGALRRGAPLLTTAAAAWLLAGCGGSTSSTNTGTTSTAITVPSLSVNIPAGQPYTFTAVAGDGSALTYTVAPGGAGGTITPAGVYTPPTNITTAPKTTDTVVVSSTNGQSQQITVNLQLIASVSPSSATASVTGTLPGNVSAPANSQVQFLATVAGDPNNGVKWTVAPATAGGAVGGIDANSGLYTPPPTATNGSQVIVTATPTATGHGGTAIASKAATATVTLQSASATIPLQ